MIYENLTPFNMRLSHPSFLDSQPEQNRLIANNFPQRQELLRKTLHHLVAKQKVPGRLNPDV